MKKKIIALTVLLAVVLSGCGMVDEPLSTTDDTADKSPAAQVSIISDVSDTNKKNDIADKEIATTTVTTAENTDAKDIASSEIPEQETVGNENNEVHETAANNRNETSASTNASETIRIENATEKVTTATAFVQETVATTTILIQETVAPETTAIVPSETPTVETKPVKVTESWTVRKKYEDGTYSNPVELSAEETSIIKNYCYGCKYEIGTADCMNDYEFTLKNGEKIYYHSECGTFNDNGNELSYKTLDYMRTEINNILCKIL